MTLRRFQIPSDEATTVTVCKQDPLFGADVDARYQELRRQIDRMSKEAE